MAISTGFRINPHNTQPIRKADIPSPKEGRSMLDMFEQMDKLHGIAGLDNPLGYLSYPEQLRIMEAAERRRREAMEMGGNGGLPPLRGLPPMPRFDPLGVPVPRFPGDRGPAPRGLPELPCVWQNDPTADPGYF